MFVWNVCVTTFYNIKLRSIIYIINKRGNRYQGLGTDRERESEKEKEIEKEKGGTGKRN